MSMPIKLPHHHSQVIEKMTGAFPNAGDFAPLADTFKHLSDPNRLRIFWALCHGEECVINISALTEMSSPAVSHHLRILKNAGLIVSRREGKEVYYRTADTETACTLHEIIEKLLKIVCPLSVH
ncbi:MAG: ArsR/SmtB family transcription factor [Pyramidobacter sp.]|jgi:DNA-binding transcriptional ArsR family regulator